MAGVDGGPGAPPTCFTVGGGGPRDVLESEILAQKNFFGSQKNPGIFLDIVLFIISNQQ